MSGDLSIFTELTTVSPSHYCVFFYKAIPFHILDCVDFSRSFSCKILDNSISLIAGVSQYVVFYFRTFVHYPKLCSVLHGFLDVIVAFTIP